MKTFNIVTGKGEARVIVVREVQQLWTSESSPNPPGVHQKFFITIHLHGEVVRAEYDNETTRDEQYNLLFALLTKEP